MTYDELKTKIRDYTEVGSSVLSDTILDGVINDAEFRIFRDVDSDNNRRYATANVIASTRFIDTPTDALIITPGNSNFYIGGVTFLDTDGNEVSSVFSDGNSNSSIQLNVPAGFDVTIVGIDTTNYQIFGNVTSTTAPAFADQ